MSTLLANKSLGIMATEVERDFPFASPEYLRRLCLLGSKAGLTVFVFSPKRIDWEQHKVVGYTWAPKDAQWVKKLYTLPGLIYDRCFFNTKQAYVDYKEQVNKLREHKAIRFLGLGLKGKWEVQQMLSQESYLRPYLPETQTLHSISQLFAWLEKNHEAILKPQGGSQGVGVLHISKVISQEQEACLYLVEGRDRFNRSIRKSFRTASGLGLWIRNLTSHRHYLIQTYLKLKNLDRTSYDIRSLVQKNGAGNWEVTGMAVRRGQPGSLTSNLHGGGTAVEVMPFLSEQFGKEKAEQLHRELAELSGRIPLVLETHHGRLVELGIDLGIDTTGHIWIIEVNSKPGRSIFTQVKNERAYLASVVNPIQYALHLLKPITLCYKKSTVQVK